MYDNLSYRQENLEALLNGNIPEHLVPKMMEYYGHLRRHEDLEKERMAIRERTVVRKELIQGAYNAAKHYAALTFDPEKERGDETRCGGLLILLGDWDEPGMSSAFISSDGGRLPAQIEYESETAPGTELSDILEQYSRDPHRNEHDLAIFLHYNDSNVKAKNVHVEGVRGTMLSPEPNGFTGGSRFRAARYFSQHNPDAVSVMVSAGEAAVYVIQNGRVKIMYDIEKSEENNYEELEVLNYN